MTQQHIIARNRANAQKSTGPRSEQGKSIVSNNARRHGATARPDPKGVAIWLTIIRDTPDLAPHELLPSNDGDFRALELAQAEVRLLAAREALHQFEAGNAEPVEDVDDLQGLKRYLIDELASDKTSALERRSAKSVLAHIAKLAAQETQIGGKRHRLFKRYLGEACSQRRRAFDAWVAWKRGTTEEPTQNQKSANHRNKPRFLAKVV